MSEGTLFDAPQAVNFRICRQCGLPKRTDEFYPNSRKCKSCICARVRENRSERREQYSNYERDRFHRPERKQQALDAQRRRRAKDPEKNAARAAVARELRAGRLLRLPCEVCGATENIQAHHNDYSKPLEIRWLCFKHHRELEHQQVVIVEHTRGGNLTASGQLAGAV